MAKEFISAVPLSKTLANVRNEFSDRGIGTYDDLMAIMHSWFDEDDEQAWAQAMKNCLDEEGQKLAEKHEDIIIVALGESDTYGMGLTFNHKTEDPNNAKIDIVFEIEMNAVVLLKT